MVALCRLLLLFMLAPVSLPRLSATLSNELNEAVISKDAQSENTTRNSSSVGSGMALPGQNIHTSSTYSTLWSHEVPTSPQIKVINSSNPHLSGAELPNSTIYPVTQHVPFIPSPDKIPDTRIQDNKFDRIADNMPDWNNISSSTQSTTGEELTYKERFEQVRRQLIISAAFTLCMVALCCVVSIRFVLFIRRSMIGRLLALNEKLDSLETRLGSRKLPKDLFLKLCQTVGIDAEMVKCERKKMIRELESLKDEHSISKLLEELLTSQSRIEFTEALFASKRKSIAKSPEAKKTNDPADRTHDDVYKAIMSPVTPSPKVISPVSPSADNLSLADPSPKAIGKSPSSRSRKRKKKLDDEANEYENVHSPYAANKPEDDRDAAYDFL